MTVTVVDLTSRRGALTWQAAVEIVGETFERIAAFFDSAPIARAFRDLAPLPFDIECELSHQRYVAWGEMLELRATPPTLPRAPVTIERRPCGERPRFEARRVRRRWRRSKGGRA